MRSSDHPPVRPTKRCLDDLDLSIPYLTEPLESIDHILIQRAQNLPIEQATGGAGRILALSDRIWYKVKSGRHRGAATVLTDREAADITTSVGRWWLCAAGYRREGDRGEFYAALEAEARRRGGKGNPSTSHLLPADWDWKRLAAELAEAWRSRLQRVVLELVARSLRSGKAHVAEFRHHRVSALVRADDGDDAYLAIIAEGIPDPKVIAIILASVPGIPADHWQPEPGSVPGLSTVPGEVIWSTCLPPTISATVLDLIPAELSRTRICRTPR
jgi:hypothetical protein